VHGQKLFVAQDNHGINAAGAARRQIGGYDCDRCDQQRYSCKGDWISGTDAEEERR
jgi:hypothetical protein